MATTSVPSSSSTTTPQEPEPRRSKKPQHPFPQWREAVAGAFSGCISRTALAPVERVKLILQLQHQKPEGRVSAFQAARDVYVNEGLFAFWRGNFSTVLRVSGTSAVNFTSLDYYKRAIVKPWLNKLVTSETAPLWWSSLLASGMAGATSTTLLYPLEFVRTRLALDSCKEFRNMRHVVTEIVSKDGITGLYQGYTVALIGGVYYRVLYLGGYDAIKSELLHDTSAEQLTWFQRLSLAQSISLMAGTLSYPMDSIRRRMMMQAGQPRQDRLYRSGWHCFQTVLKTEGMRGFFLGLGPNIVRSVGGAVLLVAYDVVRPWLDPVR